MFGSGVELVVFCDGDEFVEFFLVIYVCFGVVLWKGILFLCGNNVLIFVELFLFCFVLDCLVLW